MDGCSVVQIVVRVNEAKDSGDRINLMHDLQSYTGIKEVHFAQCSNHLMVVKYDTRYIHAKDVLDYMQMEYQHAQLISEF